MILAILFFTLNVFAQVNVNDAQDLINVNELKNGGAENGKTGWTSSGGVTVTTPNYATASKQFGKKYFNLAFDSGDTGIFEQVITVPTNLQGQGCQVEAWVSLSATTTGYELNVLDSTNALLGFALIERSTTNLEKRTIDFVCPSSSTVKVRFVVLLGSSRTVRADNIRLFQAKQTPEKFYYDGYIRANSGIVDYGMSDQGWGEALNSNNGFLVNIVGAAQIACATGSSNGANCSSANETSGITLTLPRIGNYKVCTQFSMQQNNANEIHKFRISRMNPTAQDSVIAVGTSRARVESGDDSSTGHIIEMCQVFVMTSSGLVTFKLQQIRVNIGTSDFLLEEDDNTNTWSVQEI